MALDLLLPLLAESPDEFNLNHYAGVVSINLKNADAALGYFHKALAVNPADEELIYNLAVTCRVAGDMAQSEHFFRLALSLNPDCDKALQGLTNVRRLLLDDPVVVALLNDVEDQQLQHSAFRYFSAGKILDDNQEYARAFRCYTRGNAVKAAVWNSQDHANWLARIKQVYTRKYLALNGGSGLSTRKPIFIVGMPRTGSSLLEQILSSHSRIFGAGELKDISEIANVLPKYSQVPDKFPGCMPGIAPGTKAGFAQAYLDNIAALNHQKPLSERYIDKNPLNFQYLGLISELFPQASILHIQRHPLDTLMSCFFQNFNDSLLNWSFDMENLAQYYKDYAEMMRYWTSVLPIRMLHIPYENLVQNPAGTGKRVVEFTGLHWEEECLNHAGNPALIQTASAWQARQPVYLRSRFRWKNYAVQLQSLQKLLSNEISEYEKLIS